MTVATSTARHEMASSTTLQGLRLPMNHYNTIRFIQYRTNYLKGKSHHKLYMHAQYMPSNVPAVKRRCMFTFAIAPLAGVFDVVVIATVVVAQTLSS